MKKILNLLSSPLFLVVSSLVGIGTLVAIILPISTYISTQSISTTNNFYLLGLIMFVLIAVCIFQSFLVIWLVWGKAVDAKSDNEEDEVLKMRSMRLTGTKKAFVFGIVLALNIVAFNFVGDGILITNNRQQHVLTQLRSPLGQDRERAVANSIQLIGDKKVAEALCRIMDNPGESRHWAAYAAGVRYDKDSGDSLANLLRQGNAKERAAAVKSLARLNDPRIIRLGIDAYPHMGELKQDVLLAFGSIGKKAGILSSADLEEAGSFLAAELASGKLNKKQAYLFIWCLFQFESPEGLQYLEKLLSPKTETQTLCMTFKALGNIGAADSSPKMIELIKKIDKKAACTEMVATDFAGKETLLCENLNLVERLIREIANIGDRRAKTAMERLSLNESFSESVRSMAREIAFQMKYMPIH